MGRMEKKILGENIPMIVKLLKKAYCDEMQIFHFLWYVSLNMEGIGLVIYATSLKTQATEELKHAELLSNRISELGEKAPSNTSEWTALSNIGPLDPIQHLTLRSALEKTLEFEGRAVENYNNIVKKASEIDDFVTRNLATTILADEVKDEQHIEDVLNVLEIK
jgi:bacterioferritin